MPEKNKLPRTPLIIASAALLAFLGLWEGNSQYTVYADKLAGGLPTVCKGLTRHVTNTPIIVGEKWSAAKCEAEEIRVVTQLQTELLSCFGVQPPQSVFDAATSHAWNLGVNNTCKSSAVTVAELQELFTQTESLTMSIDTLSGHLESLVK